MTNVNVHGTIDAPAEKVWNLVNDFNGLDKFVEAVTESSIEGSGAGAVRTLTLQDGGKVKEKLESLDNDRRILTYSIVESPMPIQNYRGTMQVREISDNQSVFTWSSTFETAEGADEEMEKAMENLYSMGVKGLKSAF